jgi:hypothetical protein
VTFYTDCVKMSEDFAPNFWHKRTGCWIMTTYHLTLSFSPWNFLPKNNMTVIPHPPYFSVSVIEDKTERPPFSHNWGDQGRIAGSAEHPHRTRLPECILKKGRSAGNGAYAQKGNTSRVILAIRPEVSFWPDGSTITGNYGSLFVLSAPYDMWWNVNCQEKTNAWTKIHRRTLYVKCRLKFNCACKICLTAQLCILVTLYIFGISSI